MGRNIRSSRLYSETEVTNNNNNDNCSFSARLLNLEASTDKYSKASKNSHLHHLFTLHGVTALSIFGSQLFAGLYSGEIQALDSKQPVLPHQRVGTPQTANTVKVLLPSGDRKTIFSAHSDHKIRVWRAPTTGVHSKPKLLQTLPTLSDYLLNFYRASTTSSNYIQRTRRHGRQFLWIQHFDTISGLAATSNFLYSVSWDRTLKVWSLDTLRCIQSVKAHHDAINAVTVTVNSDGDGVLVFTASADNTLKVWNHVRSMQKLIAVAVIDGAHAPCSVINAVAVMPRLLFSAGSDCSINLWKIPEPSGTVQSVREPSTNNSLKLVNSLRGHRLSVLCLAVSRHGVLCSGSADKTVRLWRRSSATSECSYVCFSVVRGHSGPVKSVAMTQYASRDPVESLVYHIYSTGLDSTAIAWSVTSNSGDDDHQHGSEVCPWIVSQKPSPVLSVTS